MMKVQSATDSIFRSRLAAQTPGQRAADDFLNSPDYWDLVNQGVHPEHRDVPLPGYHEDYGVYPGDDQAGPSRDRLTPLIPAGEHEEEPRHPDSPEINLSDLVERSEREDLHDEDERYLADTLYHNGYNFRRNGEYGKIDEHGNWHTVMLPGDYRRARNITTEFYNPRTEETRTHSLHDNVDSALDRLDINEKYSKAQAGNPNLDYSNHYHNWIRHNPQSYTAQQHRSYRLP